MIVSGIVHKLWANCRSKVYVSSLSVIGGWRPRLASVSSTQGWGFSTSRDSSPLTPTNAPKEMKRWTPDDDSMLRKAVEAHGKNWNEVVKLLPHKTVIQCRARWVSSLDPDIKLGSWSHTEDGKLRELVGRLGTSKWLAVSKSMDGRSPTACRIRWTANLDPSLNKGRWTKEEDSALLAAFAAHPKEWSTIASSLPGRSIQHVHRRYKALTKLPSTHEPWTEPEDDLLRAAVAKHTTRYWERVVADVPGRSLSQCQCRWRGWLSRLGKNVVWTEAEDALLAEGVSTYGEHNWNKIAVNIAGKTGKECMIRWPELWRGTNNAPWSKEEDKKVKLLRLLKVSWAAMIPHLPGRGREAIVTRCSQLGFPIEIQSKWTPEEQSLLRKAILPFLLEDTTSTKKRKKNWKIIAKGVPGKTPKQCMRQWEYIVSYKAVDKN